MVTVHRANAISHTEGRRRGKITAPTLVIIDESNETEIATLRRRLLRTTGPIDILVTRRRPPSPVFASGAGIDGPIMWSECHTDHAAKVKCTNRRVDELCTALESLGLGPISTIDCFPTNHFLKTPVRRQVDGVLRMMRNADVQTIVIDPSHQRLADLEAVVPQTITLD